jgi:cation:H+ antiporter
MAAQRGPAHRRAQPRIAPTLLGNTALAASVEAEELARVAVPAHRGRPGLALGNIAGTIIHFAAFNAGVIALVKPLTLAHDTTRYYLPAATVCPSILALLLLTRRQLGRAEGAVLIRTRRRIGLRLGEPPHPSGQSSGTKFR